LAHLVVLVVVCEPICMNQAARTALLATMPTLDDVDIAPMQRVDQSCGVVIFGAGGLVGVAGGHDQGGGPPRVRGGIPAGGPGGGFSPAPTPGEGKQTCVILDNDEVSSNEDEPLQKRLRWLSSAARPSGSGPATATPDAVAAADKEAAEEADVTS
jgi:hypothetical protein